MNRTLTTVLWLALTNLSPRAEAIDSCFGCMVGIWDDPALTRNYGEIVAGQPKDIYVGIKYAEGFSGTSGVSFSVVGLRPLLVLAVEPIVPPPSIFCDDIRAPADTSQGTGGCTFFWSACLAGDQALLRVSLLASSEVTNAVLKVERHYPPTYPDARTPIFYQCNVPLFTPTRASGGIYILNWNGDPTVRVGDATWSVAKQLYK